MLRKGGIPLLISLFLSSWGWAGEVRPNDPYYAGSPVSGAWEITTGASSVLVAVIDTGADLGHPDLEANLWVNLGEIPGNGLDDDGNGYVDDVHGYDFARGDGMPEDEWGHGTLTAGIIGAVGDNGIGTAGVAWAVPLMIVKVFSDEPGAMMEDYAAAIRYAIDNGAKIINASWTVPNDHPALESAVEEAEQSNVLIIASAGNDETDLDAAPVFPAAYPFENVVSVAALKADQSGLLEGSNYGSDTVKVAMSGEGVVSSYLSHDYATLSGASAATALVSGVAALILSERPDLSPRDVSRVLMESSDPAAFLQGKIASGGILNPYAGLSAALALEAGGASETPSSVRISAGCNLVQIHY